MDTDSSTKVAPLWFQQVSLKEVGLLKAPHYFRGGAFVVWCAQPYAGIFATSQQRVTDLDEVTVLFNSVARSHKLLFVDARAFGTEGPVFETMLNAAPTIAAASKHITRAAIVLPAGWTQTWWLGALELGLWGPVRVKPFSDADDAWASLNAPMGLFEHVKQLQHSITSDRKATAERAAATMRAGLEERLRADPTLTIQSVATALRCSPRALQRTLRAAGDTFANMRVRMRADTASSMLVQTDAKIESIAATVGFRSRSHFVSWFRQLTGHTPGEFRRLRRAGQDG